MGTDQAAYQSGTLFRKHFFSEVRLCLSTDCTLDALSTCDWRQINLGMIVTSKSFSPCYSFKTLGIETKVLSSKWNEKISLWHSLHILLFPIVCPLVFFSVCLEEFGPLNTNGHHNLHLWNVLTQVAKDQGCIFFFFFLFLLQKLIVWKYCHSMWCLKDVLMLFFGLVSDHVRGGAYFSDGNSPIAANYFSLLFFLLFFCGLFLFISWTNIKCYS